MTNKIPRRIIIPLIAFLLIIVIVFFVPKFFTGMNSTTSTLENWKYKDSSGNIFDIDIPQKLYKDENGNTEIFTEIPEDFRSHQALCFWTFYQSVELYLDDELVYTYDNSENGSFGEAASPTWNFVELADAKPGQRLTIKLHTPYSDLNFRMNDVVYGDLEEIHHWLENKYGFFSTVDTTVMWVGILFLVLAILQKVEKRYKLYQIYAGITLILFSIYLRTGTKGLPIYWMSSYMREFLCFFSLLNLALPLIMYIKTKVIRKRPMVIWCNILAVLQITTVSVLFLLHALGVFDLHRVILLGLIWLFAAVVTGIIFAVTYMIKYRSRFLPLTLLSLSLIVIILLGEYLQFYQLGTLPFDTGFLSHIGVIAIIAVECVIFFYYLNDESEKTKQVHQENENLRTQMLTSQIRPHFILNTIGAIRNLIKEDSDRASDLLYDFSRYIRQNLEEKDYSKPIPFPEELDYIDTYLSLEKARFGDLVQVDHDIEARNFWVLPLTIQPFVENAVKHGIAGLDKGGLITIKTRDFKEYTLIEIKDNGVGFEAYELEKKLEEKKSKSIGMRSAILRLEKEMKAAVMIRSSTDPRHSGTTIRIEIPKKTRSHSDS